MNLLCASISSASRNMADPADLDLDLDLADPADLDPDPVDPVDMVTIKTFG